MEKYVVTISRQFASMGRSIAQDMSEKLGIEFYDRDIVEYTAKRLGQPVSVISDTEENDKTMFFRRQYPLGMGHANMQDEIFDVQTNIIRDLAEKDSCIIVGRCANYVLRDKPNVLNVFIYAPLDARLKNCVELLGMEEAKALPMIRNVDTARERYRKHYCREADTFYDYHDLFIDSSRFGVEGTADVLCDVVKRMFL